MSEPQSTTDTPTADEACGCPVRPAPEIRGDSADTLVEHRPDCRANVIELQFQPKWQDCPSYHISGPSMAAKLRLIAQALDSLGEMGSCTWMSIDFQVTGDADPAGRKAAVDAIVAALGLGPAKGGRHNQYSVLARDINVYTGQLHQPECCSHCTVAGS